MATDTSRRVLDQTAGRRDLMQQSEVAEETWALQNFMTGAVIEVTDPDEVETLRAQGWRRVHVHATASGDIFVPRDNYDRMGATHTRGEGNEGS